MGVEFENVVNATFKCDCRCGSQAGYEAPSRELARRAAMMDGWVMADRYWYAPGHAPEGR